jgi:hypothetical protein
MGISARSHPHSSLRWLARPPGGTTRTVQLVASSTRNQSGHFVKVTFATSGSLDSIAIQPPTGQIISMHTLQTSDGDHSRRGADLNVWYKLTNGAALPVASALSVTVLSICTAITRGSTCLSCTVEIIGDVLRRGDELKEAVGKQPQLYLYCVSNSL